MSKKKGFLDGYKTYNPKKEGYGNPNDWREAFQARLGLEEAERVLGGSDPLMVLGITDPAATWDMIQKAYRKMAFKHHPDRFPDPEEAKKAATEFKKVQAAFEKLESIHKR